MIKIKWLKSLVKNFAPPILLDFVKNRFFERMRYKGGYSSWNQAASQASGYHAELILDKVTAAILLVKSGQAAYERDSVLFDKIEHPYSLLAGLLRAASATAGNLRVLDFGGALGTTYFQCRHFLATVKKIDWCIVEQPHFVRRGQEIHKDIENLKFFESIDDCLLSCPPNVVVLSGVLHYLDEPYATLGKLRDSGAGHVIISRTPFASAGGDQVIMQHVPATIYPATVPLWLFDKKKMFDFMSSDFDLIAEFDSPDAASNADGVDFVFQGGIWARRGISK